MKRFILHNQVAIKWREENKVLKLKNTLYGLKQTLRAQYGKIDMYFQDNDFKMCPEEHALKVEQKSRNVDSVRVCL